MSGAKAGRATLMGLTKTLDRDPVQKGATNRERSVTMVGGKRSGQKSYNAVSVEASKEAQAELILDTKVNLLSNASFIARLPRRQQEKLALAATIKTFQDQELVVTQGEDAERALLILCEGEVLVTNKMNMKDQYETETPLRVEIAPAFFGESPLLTGEPYGESVYSLGNTTFIALDGEDFDEMLGSDNKVRGVLELRKAAREAQILDHIPLLRDLTPAQRVQILHCMNTISFEDGESIFHQGARGEVFYVVCQGKVLIRKQDDDKDNVYHDVCIKHVNDFFGEYALIEDKPRSADAIAVGHVVCLYMHRSAFSERFPTLLSLLQEMSSAFQVKNEFVPTQDDDDDDDDDAFGEEGNEGKESEKVQGKSEEQAGHRTRRGGAQEDTEQSARGFRLDNLFCRTFAANKDWAKPATSYVKSHSVDDFGKTRDQLYESVFEKFCIESGLAKECHFLQTHGRRPAFARSAPAYRGIDISGLAKCLVGPLSVSRTVKEMRNEKPRDSKAKNKKGGKRQAKRKRKPQEGRLSAVLLQDRNVLQATSRLVSFVQEVLAIVPSARTDLQVRVLNALFHQSLTLERFSFGCEQVRERMVRHMELARFEKGQSIISQGSAVDGVYIILRGQVRMCMQGSINGRTSLRTIGVVGPGGSLGQLSLMDPKMQTYQHGLYTATATCRVDAVLLKSSTFHSNCADREQLEKRLEKIYEIDQLSCVAENPAGNNDLAVLPLAYEVTSQHFSKDFCFLDSGHYFDPKHCHFISRGQVSAYSLAELFPSGKPACGGPKRWVQVASLGKGECMSVLDANDKDIALAATTRVEIIKIPYKELAELDSACIATLRSNAQEKSSWRDQMLARGLRFEKIPRGTPTWRLRSQQTTSESKGKVSNSVDEEQTAPVDVSLEQLREGRLARRDSVLFTGRSSRSTSSKRRNSRKLVFETKCSERGDGNGNGGHDHHVQRKENLGTVLSVLRMHYSDDIAERHKVICPSSGTNPLKSSLIARQRSRLKFLQRVEQGNPNDNTLLKYSEFACATQHWNKK